MIVGLLVVLPKCLEGVIGRVVPTVLCCLKRYQYGYSSEAPAKERTW